VSKLAAADYGCSESWDQIKSFQNDKGHLEVLTIEAQVEDGKSLT
jgi:hypothetical protein